MDLSLDIAGRAKLAIIASQRSDENQVLTDAENPTKENSSGKEIYLFPLQQFYTF